MDVLLVEDEPLVRDILAEDLEDAGFEFVQAPNAGDGLAAAEQESTPLPLVTDVNLGAGMSGVALAAEVAHRWPDVAVVVMTSGTCGF